MERSSALLVGGVNHEHLPVGPRVHLVVDRGLVEQGLQGADVVADR